MEVICPLFWHSISSFWNISAQYIIFRPCALDLSFPCLLLYVFLYSDLSLWLLHFLKICLNSSAAFQNQIPHQLLSFTNFLSTPKFLVEILNNIRSALWRALCNISYPFCNKLLTIFLGKILQQLCSDCIFPVGLWESCESDIYYFPGSCYPVKEIELHWHELFLTNSRWLCFVFRWIQIDCLIICFSYLSIKEKLTLL